MLSWKIPCDFSFIDANEAGSECQSQHRPISMQLLHLHIGGIDFGKNPRLYADSTAAIHVLARGMHEREPFLLFGVLMITKVTQIR